MMLLTRRNPVCPVLALLVTLAGPMACSSNSPGGTTSATGGTNAGAGGSQGSGGASVTTTGGTGSGGIVPGSGGTAGQAIGTGGGTTSTGGRTGGTPGTGGVGAGGLGTGGQSTGGTSGLTLAQACTAMCGAQAKVACPDTNCQTDCVAGAAKTPGSTSCATQYTAMAQCEAGLTATQWTCSSDENVPIPTAGQCTSTVCAWACCATDLIVPSDIWARCQTVCQPVGSGGASGSGGNVATGGSSGTAGASGSTGGAKGSGGVSGTGGAIGGAGGTNPSTGIPTGYPTPTTGNAAKCGTVAMSNGVCPGGGAGPVCIQCLFGGSTYYTAETPPAPADAIAAAGDYLVSVQLGSVGPTFVSAESSRGLLAQGAASTTYSFVVDVRAMEGQPNHAGGPVGYPGLDMFFSGPTGLQISAIGYALATTATKPVMVYIAGDSTVCDQTGNVYSGWGQMLPQYFKTPVGIANYANSGASSASFYGSFWGQIKSKWTAGDWVLIQFGHNDKTATDAEVQANLEKYVADAQAANVTPILVSPPSRVQFSGSTISDQSSLHAAAAKAAAAAKGCAYIDLTALTIAWYNSLGSSSAAMKFHVSGDATHTNPAGADKIASILAGDIKTQSLGLSKYLR